MADKKEKELLFEGGPSIDQVEEWKKQYGKIYMTEIDEGDVFIWRSLTRKEFKDIMKVEGADALYREERVCERTVIWPETYDFTSMAVGKAGVPTLISEQVMDKSGFVSKTGPMEL
jgi:hypothetical protein